MQHGDLSNEQLPRLLIVFEGLLGLVDEKRTTRAAAFARLHRWGRFVNLHQLNEGLARHMWWLEMNKPVEFEVLTYLPVDALEHVEEWVGRHDLPARKVWQTDPDNLARTIAYLANVGVVYDPFPEHALKYGSKGRVISPSQFGLIGQF